MVNVRELLDRLSGVRRSGDGWIARCPAHDDKHQSLSIAEQDSRKGTGRVIVLYCHANTGCSVAEICGKLGIKEADLFSAASHGFENANRIKPAIVATYDYCDDTGIIAETSEGLNDSRRVVARGNPYVKEGLIYQSVRVEPGRDGRKKDFFQRRPGSSGQWVNNLRDVKGRWPWLLPELLESPAAIVFIVEGEKDVLTLRRLGLTATTSAGGAGKWPGSSQFNSYFKQRRVVIIADNDNCKQRVGENVCNALPRSAGPCLRLANHVYAGVDHANDVARKVKPHAIRVQVLTDKELPGIPTNGGDITDWFGLGHTSDELLAICERAADWIDPGQVENKPRRKGQRLTDDELCERWLKTSPPMIFARGDFWRYDKGLWKIRGEYLVKQEVQRVIVAAKSEGIEPSSSLVNSVWNMAKNECAIDDERLDSNYDYLMCANGALNISTGKLEQHAPAFYATTGVPYDFDPKAKGPNWDEYIKWLVDIRLGKETVDFLQEFAGLCATIDVSYEIAVWLLGQRRCGKSTFIVGLQTAFPIRERSCELSLRSIDRSQFALAQLPGKTLATATEQPAEFIRAVDLLNAIISGEPITVERKYYDAFTFTPAVKVLWSMDKMPRVSHAGSGLFERVKVIDFGREIPAEQRKPELKEGIKHEGSRILNWCLDGLRRLRERGRFVIPVKVRNSTQAFQDVNDITKAFADECLEFGPGFCVNGGDLYRAYVKWIVKNGNKPQSNTAVGLDWIRLGLEKYKSNGLSVWKGARLRSDIDDMFEASSEAPKWALDE